MCQAIFEGMFTKAGYQVTHGASRPAAAADNAAAGVAFANKKKRSGLAVAPPIASNSGLNGGSTLLGASGGR